ncbi:MAG: tetratricopeptide repeat protein [Bacteroidales bacterium]|nr:tetratricopeptide repeat protein [Bacteroidales bacterium]MBN2750166.1 tetratricopeptide repeat protein [Bacteroidales bacterium]
MKLFILRSIIPLCALVSLGTGVFSQDKNPRLDSLFNRLSTASSLEQQIDIYTNISYQYGNTNVDSFYFYAKKSIALAINSNYDTLLANSYNALGNVFTALNLSDSALHYYTLAKNIREKHGLTLRVSHSLFNIGMSYYRQNRIHESLEALKQSLKIAIDYNDIENQKNTLYYITSVYIHIHNYDKALEYALRLANVSISHQDKEALAITYAIIGEIHSKIKNIDMAKEYMQKSLDLHYSIGTTGSIASLLNNLAIIYDSEHNYTKALEYYTNALGHYEKHNDKEGISAVLNNIGYVHATLKNYDKAIQTYKNSLAISQEINDIGSIANTNNNLAQVALTIGDNNLAFKYVNNALPLARQYGDKSFLAESYEVLAKIHINRGDYKKAVEYQSLLLSYKDSLHNRERNDKVIEMQTRFETEAKEKEIQLLKKDNEIRQLDATRQKNFQKYLIILALLLLGLLFLIYYGLHLKKKSNELLSKKNEELKLANEKLRESEKNLKALNSTKDKFFSIIAHDLKNPFNALLGFSELLHHNFDNFTTKETKEYIGVINESAQSLFRLLENLLQWSRTQTGKLSYNPEKIKLYSIINQETELLRINADKKGINISIDVDNELEAFADKNIVSTVLRNFINNAIKFTHAGGSVRVKAYVDDTQKVRIDTIDDGIGINPNDINKLFRTDLSFSSKGTANEEGTGLGLIICKEFIERAGGEIIVKSNVGKGSTFSFTLPK